MQAIWFGFAIFVGWLIIDWSKEKKFRLTHIVESLIAAVIGAAGWAVIDWLF
ncbi:membrane protein DedA with SNARE-associated domain [Geomicrobium halophilum]|uniref:Membrane protein DedA with SNARE-associated domain n=1 Tax=Geomicrobium halophilum TaxID=549000 RepID=A0A841PZ73_9BACL|nr:hypothetical protein [Geomicrobium halophilum]MBB6450163.1 membrane protein DedA with SNARE-associated domain [Geomicrobium halophilum]